MRQAFEWDEDKAKANLRKHKIGFCEAATVFHDPFIANMLDPDHSYGEQRFIAWVALQGVGFWSLYMRNEEAVFGSSVVEGRHRPNGGSIQMKATEQEASTDGEMRPEYDFRGAARGKAYRPLHEGYEVQIHKADETTIVQQFILQEGTVMLEPDVQAFSLTPTL